MDMNFQGLATFFGFILIVSSLGYLGFSRQVKKADRTVYEDPKEDPEDYSTTTAQTSVLGGNNFASSR